MFRAFAHSLTLLLVISGASAAGDERKRPDKTTLKRFNQASDEDLRKQLMLVPEIGLDQARAKLLYMALEKELARLPKTSIPSLRPDLGPEFALRTVPTMKELPWITGLDCQLGREAAENLHALSLRLRRLLRDATPSDDIRPDPERLRSLLADGGAIGSKARPAEWRKIEAVPTTLQLLQGERTAMREILVDLLASADGKAASIA